MACGCIGAAQPVMGCSEQRQFIANVISVVDGDTISVMYGSRAVTIRVHGIDCPEDAQDFSASAKQELRDSFEVVGMKRLVVEAWKVGNILEQVRMRGDEPRLKDLTACEWRRRFDGGQCSAWSATQVRVGLVSVHPSRGFFGVVHREV